jgi:hypothetical protein
MIYSFKCEPCGVTAEARASISVGPPERVRCPVCRKAMERDWLTDTPMLDTSACKDANEIPGKFLTRSLHDKGTPAQIERRFGENLQRRRAEIRDAGGQTKSIKQTHAIPAHIVHGKIKQTGDKQYWNDPKNLAKHSDWKVDK